MLISLDKRAQPTPGMGILWPWEQGFWDILIPRVQNPFSVVVPLTDAERAQAIKLAVAPPKVPNVSMTQSAVATTADALRVIDSTIPTAADTLAANLGLKEIVGAPDNTSDVGGIGSTVGNWVFSQVGWGWIIAAAATGVIVFYAIGSKRR